MSLLKRAERLEDLAALATIRQESAAFWQWLRGLPHEEIMAFIEFCLPTLVEHHAAPPYTVLPSQMSPEERAAYGDAFVETTRERKKRGEENPEYERQVLTGLWHRFTGAITS
jgi:hypothetical protein